MLVFSAFVPNTPLLLPSINKEAVDLTKTSTALQELADDLYASHPDTIIILSEHPTVYEDSFSINLSDPYRFDLSEFGDLGFPLSRRPHIQLIDTLQRYLRRNEIPCTLTTDTTLHYAAAVPLAKLTEQLPDIRLIPISQSRLDAKSHFEFGKMMKDIVIDSDKRIAVIASGDMSHALSEEAPAGFAKEGVEFDQKIQDLLATKNTSGLIALDPTFVEAAKERSYRPLLMLLGMLDRVSYTPKILSYESPVGVGYLTVEFSLV